MELSKVWSKDFWKCYLHCQAFLCEKEAGDVNNSSKFLQSNLCKWHLCKWHLCKWRIVLYWSENDFFSFQMTKVDVLQLVAKPKVYIQDTVQPKNSLSITSVKWPRTKVAIKTISIVIRHTFYNIKLFYTYTSAETWKNRFSLLHTGARSPYFGHDR